VVGDAPGERLGALAQERRRSTAEHKEARGATGSVRQHAKHREKVGPALDLVEHDQAPEPFKGEHGRVETRPRSGVLEIEECRSPAGPLDQRARERALANLSRADQSHHRKLPEQALQDGQVSGTLDHGLHVTMKIRSLNPVFPGSGNWIR
jgi:hypothetical protein